ncbi:MAG: hypothetical protein ACRYGL_06165 [Janthinobacterium lividum]
MNKLIAALIAGLFATAAFAQTPASDAASTPVAASSTKMTKKHTAHKAHKAHKAGKSAKKASTVEAASAAQ